MATRIALNEDDVMTLTAALGYAHEKYAECRATMLEAGGRYLEVAKTFEKQQEQAIRLQRMIGDAQSVTLEVS